MKSILEIPVFAPQEYFKNLINNSNNIERPYQDFSLFEFELNDTHTIYFYLLNVIPEQGLDLLIDKVIPKAPFSLLFIETDADAEKTKSLYLNYIERYSTPIFLCSAKENSKDSEAFANDLSLDKFESKLLLFEGNDPASLKKVIIEVLKFITAEGR